MKDSENIDFLVSKIISGKSGRDEIIKLLYYDNVLRRKINTITKNILDNSHEEDIIFNTSILRFVSSIVKNQNIEITASVHSYICGIAKYICLNNIKKAKKQRFENLDEIAEIEMNLTPETTLIDQQRSENLFKLLNGLNKNCREVLMYWANDYSMIEIAEVMGYKSDMMARKKKYQCYKQLVKILESRPEIKNFLK